MFYFDSNMFVPLKCPELVFWKADVDRMTFGRLLLLFPPSGKEHTFSISRILFSFSFKTLGYTWEVKVTAIY